MLNNLKINLHWLLYIAGIIIYIPIIVDAKIDWQTFNSKFGKIIPDGDYETLAGFVLYILGEIPSEGDHFNYRNFRLQVVSMKEIKIEHVEIIVYDNR